VLRCIAGAPIITHIAVRARKKSGCCFRLLGGLSLLWLEGDLAFPSGKKETRSYQETCHGVVERTNHVMDRMRPRSTRPPADLEEEKSMRIMTLVRGVSAFLLLTQIADAGLITYTETATATGKLGSDSFSSAMLTFSGTGNTSDITEPIRGLFVLDLQSLNVSVAGVGSATLTDQIAVEDDALYFGEDNAGFFDATLNPNPGQAVLILSTLNPVFANYELATSIGPVSGAVDFVSGGYKTTSGLLILDSIAAGSTRFGAVMASAVPEPAGFMMLGLGLVLVGWSGTRRGLPRSILSGRRDPAPARTESHSCPRKRKGSTMIANTNHAPFISVLILVSMTGPSAMADDGEATVFGRTVSFENAVVVNYKALLSDYEDVKLSIEEREVDPLTKVVIHEERLVIKAKVRRDFAGGAGRDTRRVEVDSGLYAKTTSVDLDVKDRDDFSPLRSGDRVVGYYEFGRSKPSKITFLREE
jgi:hypothetical protein